MKEDVEDKNCCISKENISDNGLSDAVSTSFLPKQNFNLDQPLEASLFKKHTKSCEDHFKRILSVLENQNENTTLNKKSVISIVLLCGEHSRDELWTSRQTVILAEQLLRLVLEKCNCKSILDLLVLYKIDLFFTELRPKLLKNTIKDYPAAVACFTWLLFHIKCPHLGEVLNGILPTCLLLIDDHEYSNKIKGLQCLEHVANNVSRAELNQYGRGSVIYNALEHMIYLRDPEVIPPLGACLVALLSKTEHGLTTQNLSWSHFDDVMSVWLPSMEGEQRLLLREAYIDSLNSLLGAMGLASVRWSKKLLTVLAEYCEQHHTRDKAIMALLTFMKVTWPRLQFNFQQIVLILMKIVINISKDTATENSSQETLKLIRRSFALLESVCQEEYNSFLNDIKNTSDLKDCLLLVTDQSKD